MEIKDYVVKISGKISILQELDMGRNYKLEIDSTITSVTDSDNHDGSITRYYKCEPILAKVILDNGEVIKAKDTRSRSQLLRARLWKQWQNSKSTLEFDDWYGGLMNNLIQQADELAGMYAPS